MAVVLWVDGREQHAVDFVGVRDDEVGVRVLDPVNAVRQDEGGRAVRVGVTDNVLAELLSADALFVVGDDDGVESFVEVLVNEVIELVKEGVVVGLIVVEVEAEDLLILADDADLSVSEMVGDK